jgi:hypothetical protein
MRTHPTSHLIQAALVLLPTSAVAQEPAPPAEPAPEPSGFSALEKALGGGRAWLRFRYRYEYVDQDGFAKHAYASTLRTVLGYETASFSGFQGLIEFEDVTVVGNELYDSGVNGITDRPVVTDPDGTEVNQVYLRWSDPEIADARVGRQEISLDNQRWVGTVSWRQNEQTFDAASLGGKYGALDLFYGYVVNANRVVGEDSPRGDDEMSSHLANAKYAFEGLGDLVVYDYYLDYDDVLGLSRNSLGGRFTGKIDLGEDLPLGWALEYAQQTDVGDNPSDVDADYALAELWGKVGAVKVLAGYELLSGSGDPGDALQTPLATLHAFNGWSDKFLTTPDTGLEDVYAGVHVDAGKFGLDAFWHQFSADSGGADYGTELDLSVSYPVRKGITAGLKFAAYDAEDFATDTTKAWVWLAWTPLG